MGLVISNSRIVWFIALGFLALNCFTGFGSRAQLLPLEEVKTLETISQKLQNSFWNISQSSCQDVDASGFRRNFTDEIIISVTCDCSFANNTCHVTNFVMKGTNLTGVLPGEFGNLTHLQELDLTRNYINGSIPASISRAPLQTLSLLGNRLGGSIPPEIGDMTTLTRLVLEDNLLEGPLPENLGSLSSLEALFLAANNFTGTIPESFGKLKNLTDFRIDGSRISGKIPNLIGNWTKLERLDMQGTSLEGPIPSNISLLTELTELRVSDLNGSSMTFPNLEDLKNLKVVSLRNCSITGSIPSYIGEMTKLVTLDLSFNKLTGVIPNTIEGVSTLDHMYLSNNLLTGELPSWIVNNKNNLDLSYNNFTGLPPVSCQQLTVNLISSSSSPESSWCLQKNLPCSSRPKQYSLFINCGGEQMEYGGNQYEQDLTNVGASHFISSAEKWGYSSTGFFTGNARADYVATNKLPINVNGPELYQTARLSPLSLKYYGLCLLRGSYNVKLHFAEIMFSDNETFTGIGKRIFDVSIQGSLVLKDFNIMEEAGGAGKGIIKEYDVLVNDGTLEIHFYWAGKGTNAIPSRGVYGPLISAISVTPNFKVDLGGGGLSAGAIAGIVVASCVFIVFILALLRYMGYLGGQNLEEQELRRELELQTGYFTLRQIKAATDTFDPSNKIGEGGFGPVYKGVLSNGSVIAVKQLSSKSKQGNREFVNEIGMISALQHPNLVRLFGCCIEGNQLLLVYEYMENNSLARALFGRQEQRLHLNWKTRMKICVGIARGLAYLHEESRLKIVHRDIKATNVLLDKDLNAKISDFGLAKLDEGEDTHISTRIAGTIGYMAPEYAMRGYLTDKADVYSFGIVALEIVSGKSNTNYKPKEDYVYLLDEAYVQQEQGNMLELVDPDLGSKYSKEEAMTMLNLALLCTNPSPTLRPPMSSVVSMLEGKSPIQVPLIKRGTMEKDARFKAFERLSQDSQTQVSDFSQNSQTQVSDFSQNSQTQVSDFSQNTQTQVSTFSLDSHGRGGSMDGPWIDSSVSLPSSTVENHEHSSTTLKDS